jgi:hypothetical protein
MMAFIFIWREWRSHARLTDCYGTRNGSGPGRKPDRKPGIEGRAHDGLGHDPEFELGPFKLGGSLFIPPQFLQPSLRTRLCIFG